MKYFILILFFYSVNLPAQNNFDVARGYFDKGEYSKAKPFFEKSLQQNPADIKTMEYLGDIEAHNKSWDKAIFYYKKVKALNPVSANSYYKYGGALAMKAARSNQIKALGMVGEIRSNFEKSIQLNPKHIEARWALIELYLQLPGIVGGSESKANRYANELAQLSAVDGYLSKGHIAEYFKRYEEAERQYKLAVQISHSKTSSQILANLYKNKMNRPDKAQAVLAEFQKKG